MPATRIEPTVGRVVYFRRAGADPATAQPEAALLVGVHDDGRINLAVFDHEGNKRSELNVQLVQDGETPPDGAFAHWMPYQIGQARK